jgi:hypothetical protein
LAMRIFFTGTDNSTRRSRGTEGLAGRLPWQIHQPTNSPFTDF